MDVTKRTPSIRTNPDRSIWNNHLDYKSAKGWGGMGGVGERHRSRIIRGSAISYQTRDLISFPATNSIEPMLFRYPKRRSYALHL